MIHINKSQPDKRVENKTKAAIPVSLVLIFWLAACGNNESFNSAEWLNADIRVRGRMCEDLVRSKMLIGQTDAEARRLQVYARALSYKIDLGWPLKDPKRNGLQVHLDENRNVREVKIVD